MDNISEESQIREFGPQPLDAILTARGLDASNLVNRSTEQLTHKQIQKARRGRYVTGNIQRKILSAVNAAIQEQRSETDEEESAQIFALRDLFNYRP